ncbi:MAG: hypothetical protein ACKO45_07835 [Cyanobium sp.]
MVTKEDLEGLDLLLWHGNGPKAAKQLHCNQSTISRRVQRCLSTFGVRIKRLQGEWTILGPSLLLQMEREIHQLARLLGQHPLRLEGFPGYSAPLLKPPPPGWILGPHDSMSTERPLTLLRERIIDVWLTDAADDLSESLDFPVEVWLLARQSVGLSADPRHPLAGETNVPLSDVVRFPVPTISANGFPRSHAICERLGLGFKDVAMCRYDAESWQGMTANAFTLTYDTPMHSLVFKGLVPLDMAPLFSNRLALVCRADVAEHARVQDLHCLMKARLQQLQSQHPRLDRLKVLP